MVDGPVSRLVTMLLCCALVASVPGPASALQEPRETEPAPQPSEAPAADETTTPRQLLDAIRVDLVELRFEKALAALEPLLTSPTLTYTEAQQQTDFTTPILAPYPKYILRVKIYQISGSVGRGFVKDVTLDATPTSALDPCFGKVVWLCLMNQPGNAANQIERSRTGHAIFGGNGETFDTPAKFGTLAMNSNDLLGGYVASNDHADFDFGSGDFTVEGWWRWTTTPTNLDTLISKWKANAVKRTWILNWTTSFLQFQYSTTGADVKSLDGGTFTPTAGVYYHIAVSRNGPDLRLFRDGTQEGSTFNIGTDTLDLNNSQMWVGSSENPGTTFPGRTDSARITKGIGRYTENFTAPTGPFGTQ